MIMTTKMKTEAASMVSCCDHKKKCDTYCKKLLPNKQVPAYVMKGCVPEYTDTPLGDIPSYTEMFSINTTGCEYIGDHRVETTDETIPRAQIKYGVQLEAAIPMKQKEAGKGTPAGKKVRMIVNLESQAKNDPGYPLIKRALYYYSRLVVKQKHPKNGSQHPSYDRIKKVRSIWICIGHNNQKNDVISAYRIQETCKTGIWHVTKKDYDLLTAVMVYPKKEGIREAQDIPNAVKQQDGNKQRLLELLRISFIENLVIEDKKEQLQKTYDILVKKEIDQEVIDMCNFSDFIEQRGIERGLEQGLKKGLLQGKVEGKVEVTLLHVKELMQSININAVDTMNMLNVEDDIRPAILQSLQLS